MKRVIRITETLEKTFVVDAETEHEALDIVNNEYRRKCNIVLEADDFTGSEIEDVTDEYTCDAMEYMPKITDLFRE